MARILVADAQKEFKGVLQTVLTQYGHEVLTADTDEGAIKLLETRSPDIVLLDLAMRGTPTAIGLAKLKAVSPDVPVIAMGTEISSELESLVREMGVTDVLRKDLKMDVIMQAVTHAFEHIPVPIPSARHEAGRPDSASAAPAGKKLASILIVDDEAEICEMVGEFLSKRGYQIRTAYNGEEALQAVAEELPDLVLLDIYMPGINGVEVLRRFQKGNLLTKLGVIMVTASQEEPLLQEALNLGAFDVISKTASLNDLELAVAVKLALSAPD